MAVSEEIHVDLIPSFITKHKLNVSKLTIFKVNYNTYEILLGSHEQPFSNVVDTLRLNFKDHNGVGLKYHIEGVGYLLCVRDEDKRYANDTNITKNVIDLLDQYFIYYNSEFEFNNPKKYTIYTKECQDLFPEDFLWHSKITITIEKMSYELAKIVFLSSDDKIVRMFVIEKRDGVYRQLNSGLNFGFLAAPNLGYINYTINDFIKACVKFENLNKSYDEYQEYKNDEAMKAREILKMQANQRARA